VIYRTEVFVGRTVINFFIIVAFFAITQFPAFAVGSVQLAWFPSADTNVVGYNIYYGSSSGNYTTKISVGDTTNAIVTDLAEGTTYYFAATASDDIDDESPFSNEITYSILGDDPTNRPPTLNSIKNLAINENAPKQTVKLTGITSGAKYENQKLTVTAISSNPGLIPNPTVNYAGTNGNGTLTFAPALDANGKAQITVTVNDNQTLSNIISRTFTVTVKPVNQPPTLDSVTNITIYENDPAQTVFLTGITSGASNEVQNLKITATSSKQNIIRNPAVHYVSPESTGTLTFAPLLDANGTTLITVKVTDSGNGQHTISKQFIVTVIPVNQLPTLKPIKSFAISENSKKQTVNLSDITSGASNEKQKLTVTAISSNPDLIPNPAINYTSPHSSGTLTFTPATNTVGTATITVTVNDGQTENNTANQTFIVMVNGQTATTSSVSLLSAQPLDEPPATLTMTNHTDGQFAFTVVGVPEEKYAVQVSSNLVDWTSVETNASPFTFVDVNASQFKQRFYRSVSVP
jgi:hypothetical protein